jgi:hypothetical protein
LDFAILACGTAELSIAELTSVRQQSLERFSASLRPQLLKHSDDQTLTAAVALDNALRRLSPCETFADWAIVTATQYLGRREFAAVIDKYKIDGPWGVSVQVIPHTSPHALASTLSMALASHGPSIGVGAAAGEEGQALLAAATLVVRPEIGGAWIVFSGWSDEASRDVAVREPVCRAVVLAVSRDGGPIATNLSAVGRITMRSIDSNRLPASNSPALENLSEWLLACGASSRCEPRAIEITLGGGTHVQIELS